MTSLYKECDEFITDGSNAFVLQNTHSRIYMGGQTKDGDGDRQSWLSAIKWRNKHLPPGSMWHMWHMYTLPTNEGLRNWINPFGAHGAYDSLTPNWESVVIKDEFVPPKKKKLLDEMEAVYGRNLSVDEWIKFGKLNPRDFQIWRTIFRSDFESQLKDKCYDIMMRCPGLGGISRFYSVKECKSLIVRLYLWWQYHQSVKKKEINTNRIDVEWYDRDDLLAVFAKTEAFVVPELRELKSKVPQFFEVAESATIECNDLVDQEVY